MLGALGGSGSHNFEHGAEVGEGVPLRGVGVDEDGGLVGAVGAVEESVEGGEKGLAAGDAEGGVLALAEEGFECLAFHAALVEKGPAVVVEELEFVGGQFHGAVDSVKDPAEGFFLGVPDPFPFQDQFLVGDGVFAGVARGRRGWEDLVDGVEEGPAVVSEGVKVGGLDEAAVVIHVALDEV